MIPYEEVYRCIQPLLESSKSKDAIVALSNLVKTFPEFAQVHNNLGVLYYQSGEKEKALNHYEQAAQLDPGNTAFKKDLADFYYVEQGKVDEALKIYRKVLEHHPEDVKTIMISGHLSLALHKFGDAKAFYARVLEIEPWNLEARQYLDKLQETHPTEATYESAEEWYQSLQSQIGSQPPQYFIGELEKMLQSFPDFALAQNQLGVLYYNQGQKELAQGCYEKAVQLEPLNVIFRKNLADFYCIELGRLEEALKLYNDVLASQPEDVETLLSLGHICTALGKIDDAKFFYNRVLDIEPWNLDASESLEKVNKNDPLAMPQQSPEEKYQDIQSRLNSERPEKIIEELELLLQTFPDYALAHNDLGVFYYKTGEREKSLVHYEKAAQLEPANVTFKKNLADFYYVEQGRVEDALKIYVDILAINPEDIETLQITGHICVALHKFEDAKTFYNRVLEIEPWNIEARNYLDKLQLKEKAG